MSLGDTLKRFTLSDNFILNVLGNLVGIKNPNANGADLRVDTMPAILGQSGVPVILPSSGSANGSGVITHTTALPYTPSGPVQVYLPAGVVTGGSQGSGAGLYTAVYSSTTVCQIAGTGIVTTAGAYTQTTGADIALASVAVPAGAMGINGGLRVDSIFSAPNTAGNKTGKLRLAASVFASFTVTSTQIYLGLATLIKNRGVQNSQVGGTVNLVSPYAATSSTPAYAAVDTSAQQTMAVVGQIAAGADYMILECYTVEVLPGLQ